MKQCRYSKWVVLDYVHVGGVGKWSSLQGRVQCTQGLGLVDEKIKKPPMPCHASSMHLCLVYTHSYANGDNLIPDNVEANLMEIDRYTTNPVTLANSAGHEDKRGRGSTEEWGGPILEYEDISRTTLSLCRKYNCFTSKFLERNHNESFPRSSTCSQKKKKKKKTKDK
jgi:hypothetical protein